VSAKSLIDSLDGYFGGKEAHRTDEKSEEDDNCGYGFHSIPL